MTTEIPPFDFSTDFLGRVLTQGARSISILHVVNDSQKQKSVGRLTLAGIGWIADHEKAGQAERGVAEIVTTQVAAD